MKTKTLYRPVGEKELVLIAQSDFKKFPTRLAQQPIFYPVLNEQYACEIAEKWNTKDAFGNYLGFVTKFEITEDEFSKYKVENVGGKIHDELWVPAEDLELFNESIIGQIEVIKVFIGQLFERTSSTEIQDILNQLQNEN